MRYYLLVANSDLIKIFSLVLYTKKIPSSNTYISPLRPTRKKNNIVTHTHTPSQFTPLVLL